MAQRRALVMEDTLHRNIYAAAARPDLAYLMVQQDAHLSQWEQHKLQDYAVSIVAARHGFNPLPFNNNPCPHFVSGESGDEHV